MHLHIATLNVLGSSLADLPHLAGTASRHRVRELMFNEFDFFMRYLLRIWLWPEPKLAHFGQTHLHFGYLADTQVGRSAEN